MDEKERKKRIDNLLENGEFLIEGKDENKKAQIRRKGSDLLKRLEENQKELDQKRQSY